VIVVYLYYKLLLKIYDIVPLLLYTGKAESRQRVVEESRSSNSYTEHAARGVCRYGRFAGISLERRKRCTSKEKLLVTPERRISPVCGMLFSIHPHDVVEIVH